MKGVQAGFTEPSLHNHPLTVSLDHVKSRIKEERDTTIIISIIITCYIMVRPKVLYF